jgi:hypothetical protein
MAVMALREPFATLAAAAVFLDLTFNQVQVMTRTHMLPLARLGDGSLFMPTGVKLIPSLELRDLCDGTGRELWERWQAGALEIPALGRPTARRRLRARDVLAQEQGFESAR